MENICEISYDANLNLTIKFVHNNPMINFNDNIKPSLNGFINDLFDALGDYDIIIANELNPDFILGNGENIYSFTKNDEYILKTTGIVTLEFENKIDNIINENNQNDVDFMIWLRGEHWRNFKVFNLN